MDIKYDFKNICPVCRDHLSLDSLGTDSRNPVHIFLCNKETCRAHTHFKASPIVLYYDGDQQGDKFITALNMMEINLSKYKLLFTTSPLSLTLSIFDSENYILDLAKPLLTKWGSKAEKDYRIVYLNIEEAIHFDPDKPADDLLPIMQTMLAFS